MQMFLKFFDVMGSSWYPIKEDKLKVREIRAKEIVVLRVVISLHFAVFGAEKNMIEIFSVKSSHGLVQHAIRTVVPMR